MNSCASAAGTTNSRPCSSAGNAKAISKAATDPTMFRVHRRRRRSRVVVAGKGGDLKSPWALARNGCEATAGLSKRPRGNETGLTGFCRIRVCLAHQSDLSPCCASHGMTREWPFRTPWRPQSALACSYRAVVFLPHLLPDLVRRRRRLLAVIDHPPHRQDNENDNDGSDNLPRPAGTRGREFVRHEVIPRACRSVQRD